MSTYHIGLSSTFHDPAIAIVGPSGEVLFAEATERHLGDKRAPNLTPDPPVWVAQALAEHCSDADALTVNLTWSRGFLWHLRNAASVGHFRLSRIVRTTTTRNRSLLPERDYRTFGTQLLAQNQQAGIGTMIAAARVLGITNLAVRQYDHHLTHAAHACLTSPFADAVCVVIDGSGEFGSFSIFQYSEGRLRRLKRGLGFGSLGFFYAALTDLCGFNYLLGDEGKTMGLAAFGKPRSELIDLVQSLCRVRGERIRVPGRRQREAILRRLAPHSRGPDEDPMRAADLAYAAQVVFEKNVSEILGYAASRSASRNLVLTGGCALNSSSNGRIAAEANFADLYIPSAPADDGNAIGAGLLSQRKADPSPWSRDRIGLAYPFLGSTLDRGTIARFAKTAPLGARFDLAPEERNRIVAVLLSRGCLVAWLQGRAEFGPRALGHRSIIASPAELETAVRLNSEVKLREPFRPFAPAILHEFGPHFFESYTYSPFMERVMAFRPTAASRVPAVVHADGTGRVQSVTRQNAPVFYGLLSAFYELTGVPILLNTSCNIMGRPIMHSIEDALGHFHTSGLDVLVMEDCLIVKPHLFGELKHLCA